MSAARAKGKWLFVPLEHRYVLHLGECGGRVEKMAYLGGACYVCPQCQQ